MKYVVYGDTRVMTGDAIAEAVLAYAAALGENGTTDIVEIPTADGDGAGVHTEMLLGPASQVMLEVAPDDELEPEDEDLVNELVRRTRPLAVADSRTLHHHTPRNPPPRSFGQIPHPPHADTDRAN